MAIDEELIGVSKDYVVTETSIDPKLPFEDVVAFLRERKTTGSIVVHMTQGGIQKVAVTEKTKTVLED